MTWELVAESLGAGVLVIGFVGMLMFNARLEARDAKRDAVTVAHAEIGRRVEPTLTGIGLEMAELKRTLDATKQRVTTLEANRGR